MKKMIVDKMSDKVGREGVKEKTGEMLMSGREMEWAKLRGRKKVGYYEGESCLKGGEMTVGGRKGGVGICERIGVCELERIGRKKSGRKIGWDKEL